MKVLDFVEYTENAPNIEDGLLLVWGGVTKKDAKALHQWLNDNKADIEGVSWLLIGSHIDSHDGNLSRDTIRTGKRGRPRTEVTGTVIDNHLHGLFLITKPVIDIESLKKKIAPWCRKRKAKRSYLKQQKFMKLKGMDGIGEYMTGQSDYQFSSHDFDFPYFDDIRYYDEKQYNALAH